MVGSASFQKTKRFWFFYTIYMMLCHYLTPLNIVIHHKPSGRDDLFKHLAFELAKQNDIKNASYLAQSIIDRENEGSTFLPTGIAIPHARVPDVSEIKLIMGVVPDGLKETPESDPTYLFFLFFSPVKDKEFGRHLKLLARISSTFRDPAFVREVAGLKDVDKIFALIQHRERDTLEE